MKVFFGVTSPIREFVLESYLKVKNKSYNNVLVCIFFSLHLTNFPKVQYNVHFLLLLSEFPVFFLLFLTGWIMFDMIVSIMFRGFLHGSFLLNLAFYVEYGLYRNHFKIILLHPTRDIDPTPNDI